MAIVLFHNKKSANLFLLNRLALFSNWNMFYGLFLSSVDSPYFCLDLQLYQRFLTKENNLIHFDVLLQWILHQEPHHPSQLKH